MRIAIVYDMLYPWSIGGAEARNESLARALARRGHEVHLYGVKLWKGADVIIHEGVTLHGVCRYQRKYDFRGKRSALEPLWFSARLVVPLLKERFDVIDCSSFPYFPALSCKLSSLVHRVPLIITWHEVWDDYWYDYLGWKGIIGKEVERLVAQLTPWVIAVSHLTRRNLIMLRVPPGEITVVPNWVDLSEIQRAKRSSQRFDVIFAGRLMRHKNIALLLDALTMVQKRFPGLRAAIVGEGPEKQALQAYARSLGLGRSVSFFDFLPKEQFYGLLKSSKLFVLPSTLEGFGISVIEAQAAGLPVITANHPRNAAAELVKDGQNGFVCRLAAPAIAERVCQLLTDRRLLTRFSSASRASSLDYGLEGAVAALEDSYCRAAQQRSLVI